MTNFTNQAFRMDDNDSDDWGHPPPPPPDQHQHHQNNTRRQRSRDRGASYEVEYEYREDANRGDQEEDKYSVISDKEVVNQDSEDKSEEHLADEGDHESREGSEDKIEMEKDVKIEIDDKSEDLEYDYSFADKEEVKKTTKSEDSYKLCMKSVFKNLTEQVAEEEDANTNDISLNFDENEDLHDTELDPRPASRMEERYKINNNEEPEYDSETNEDSEVQHPMKGFSLDKSAFEDIPENQEFVTPKLLIFLSVPDNMLSLVLSKYTIIHFDIENAAKKHIW